VPLLVHDGTAIFESVAIMLHLGETFGVEKKLFPAPGLARAEAFKWLVWANVTLGEALSRFQHNTSPRIPAERHNAKAGEVGKADVEKCLAILDAALAKKTFLVSESFSLVDVHLASFVGYIGFSGFDLKTWPNVEAWHTRSTSRPAYALAMATD
jgi:glutathione S-transferase